MSAAKKQPVQNPKGEEILSRRHPLQRLDSPSKGFSGVLHVAGLISFYNSFKFLSDNPNVFNESFGWHLQFLTIIGLSLSTLTFTLALLSDLISTRTVATPNPTLSERLFQLKNYASLVATPMEITITLLYWTLKAIDPALVVPPHLPMPPFIYDLGFHLAPSVVLAIDAIFLSPPWPTSPMNPQAPLFTLAMSTVVAFLYWIWIEVCFAQNGFYPYPLFELLTTYQRIGLFVVSGVVMWVVGGVLRAAYAWANGYETIEEVEKRKRARVMGGSGKWE